jgi:hypothetical protein
MPSPSEILGTELFWGNLGKDVNGIQTNYGSPETTTYSHGSAMDHLNKIKIFTNHGSGLSIPDLFSVRRTGSRKFLPTNRVFYSRKYFKNSKY